MKVIQKKAAESIVKLYKNKNFIIRWELMQIHMLKSYLMKILILKYLIEKSFKKNLIYQIFNFSFHKFFEIFFNKICN